MINLFARVCAMPVVRPDGNKKVYGWSGDQQRRKYLFFDKELYSASTLQAMKSLDLFKDK